MLAADPACIFFGQPEHEEARLGRPITPIRNAPTREARQSQGGEIVAQLALTGGVLRIWKQSRSGVPGGDEGPGVNAVAGEESIEFGMAPTDANLDAAPGGIGHERRRHVGPLQGRALCASGVVGWAAVCHGIKQRHAAASPPQIAPGVVLGIPGFPASRDRRKFRLNVPIFLAAVVNPGRYVGVASRSFSCSPLVGREIGPQHSDTNRSIAMTGQRLKGAAERPGTALRHGLLRVERLERRSMLAADAGFAAGAAAIDSSVPSWTMMPVDMPNDVVVAPIPIDVSCVAIPVGPTCDPTVAFDQGIAVDWSGDADFIDGFAAADDSWTSEPDWRWTSGDGTVDPGIDGSPGSVAFYMFSLPDTAAGGPAGDAAAGKPGELMPSVAAAASGEGRPRSQAFAVFSGTQWALTAAWNSSGGFAAAGDTAADGGFAGGRRRPRR